MAIAQTLTVASAPTGSSARLQRLDVKKAGATRDFDRRWEDPGWTGTGKRSETSTENLSHSGTNWAEPLWSGPCLRAPFVAQLLGQLMPSGNSDLRSALQAYRGRANSKSIIWSDVA
jgi:hypothetical protein